MTTAAPTVALADAVTDLLNAAPEDTFSQEFEAARVYQRPDDGENARGDFYNTLRVFVVPGPMEETPVAKARVGDVMPVAVLVMKHLDGGQDADPTAEMDALALFVVELSDYLRTTRLAASESETESTPKWQGAQIDPTFDTEALQTRRQFSSTLIVTYLQHRQ